LASGRGGGMARMPIEILDLRRNPNYKLSEIVDEINRAQSCYEFVFLDTSKAVDLALAIRDDTNISQFISNFKNRRIEWRGYHPFIICLFDTPINDAGVGNLFSVESTLDGFAAFTLHNVEKILIPTDKIDSYLVYYFGFFALRFSGIDLPFHKENRGCIYDYREEKTGIIETIKNGVVCDKCKDILLKHNNPLSPTKFTSIFTILGLASSILRGDTSMRADPGPSKRKQPKIFVGSSTEGLTIARALQSELEQ
jgi:hypothetical protein